MDWYPIDSAPAGDGRVLLFLPCHGFDHNVMVTGYRKAVRDLRGDPSTYWVSVVGGGAIRPTHWAPTPAAPVVDTMTQEAVVMR